MAVRILPRRRILQNSCWPYSGKRYSVWEYDPKAFGGSRAILQTDDLTEAQDKAGEI